MDAREPVEGAKKLPKSTPCTPWGGNPGSRVFECSKRMMTRGLPASDIQQTRSGRHSIKPEPERTQGETQEILAAKKMKRTKFPTPAPRSFVSVG